MNQKTLGDLAVKSSSKTPSLKPGLATALSSLEVQLDQELARYRRTRTGQRTANQSRAKNYIGNQSQQLSVITTSPDSREALFEEIKVGAVYQDELSVEENEVNTSWASVGEISPTNQTPATETPPETGKSASIVTTVVKSEKSENSQNSNDTATQPDDYLESSEALLRSLTEKQPEKTQPSKNSNESLLSPLGIGSILLLLMGSLTLGYFFFNPKSLSMFSFGGLFGSNSSSPTAQKTQVAKPKPIQTAIPKRPNLATEEFAEVNDPNDVVNLKPKAKPTNTAQPKPIAAQNPVNAVPINPATPVQQIQPLKTPQTPKPAVPKLIGEIKPSADGFYHVIIDNQKETAFVSARQVVPDAYLSPDQKLIYLGAFKTKQEVQQQIQQLQAKGISARVQQP